ncbi:MULTISPECIES: hypothetical protein [Mumia]|uniref:hypothetical protein n=1 Tax=Mumia TaxID=1546255 RepID=UPI00141D8EC3|nr:hypothetical protein [Mumia sp. ZJ430]
MTDTLDADARTQERRGMWTSAYATFVGTWQIGAYFWIAVVLISVGLTVVIDTWADVEGSIADGVLGSAPYFLGVMGIIIPLAMLPMHLAGGATRRSFTRGVVVAGFALGVTYAFAGAVGMLVESLVFGGLDWSTAIADPGLYDSSGDFFGIWLSWSLTSIAYFLGGVALAVGYYRWGGIGGTVGLILVVTLVVGAEIALGGGVYSAGVDAVLGDNMFPAVVLVLISLAAIAAVVAILHRLLRDIPLRPSATVTR